MRYRPISINPISINPISINPISINVVAFDADASPALVLCLVEAEPMTGRQMVQLGSRCAPRPTA
jgi:hypothetical protein